MTTIVIRKEKEILVRMVIAVLLILFLTLRASRCIDEPLFWNLHHKECELW